MAGSGFKCKNCGTRFRIIWGLSPKEVSEILGRDCGYKLTEGKAPSKDLANVVCSQCGGEGFEKLDREESLELQIEWMRKGTGISSGPVVENGLNLPSGPNCPICGKSKDISKTKYNLPVCSNHYVDDVRKFLIPNYYLRLRKKIL